MKKIFVKNKKRITVFLLAIITCLSVILFVGSSKIDDASASDYYSDIYGFSLDTDYYDISWMTLSTLSIKQSNFSRAMGSVRYHIGKIKSKTSVNGKYIYGVLIYSTMDPQTFTATALDGSGSTTDFRGRSKYLQYSTTLGSDCTLLTAQPENMAGSSSYNVGLTLSARPGISASTSVTQNALQIINYSNFSSRYYDVQYEYKRHTWPWEWERTYYCWNSSVQRSAYFFESSSSSVSHSLKVSVSFAIDGAALGAWNTDYFTYATTSTYKTVSIS